MIGERIKELREEYELTQAKLSQELGINISTLASYESGAREPNISKIIMFAKYFYVSTDYLLGFSPFKNKDTEKHIYEFRSELDEIFQSMPVKDQSTLMSELIPMFRTNDEYEKTMLRQRIFSIFAAIRSFIWCYRSTKVQILSCSGSQENLGTNGTGILESNMNEKTYMMTQSLLIDAEKAASLGHLKMAVGIILPYFDYLCKDMTQDVQKQFIHLIAEMADGIRDFSMRKVPMLTGIPYDCYATEEYEKKAKEFLSKVKDAEKNGDDKKA